MLKISRRDALKQTCAAGVSATYFATWSAKGAGFKDPLAIGKQRQLFFDNTVIAEMKHLSRTWHQAEKLPEPVVRADRPNDFGGIMIFPGDVLYDDNERMFKMWYSGLQWA